MPTALAKTLPLHDCRPQAAHLLEEVLDGLQRRAKELPCKYFYDARGSQLFDRICELDEYYPTRTESHIMHQHGAQMAECLGRNCLLIEYGSGSGTKTRILLDHLLERNCEPAAYLPLDISRQHLLQSAARLTEEYPGLAVQPICADYTKGFSLPHFNQRASKTVVYFPGSTIGNFHPQQAHDFLRHIAHICSAHGGLLIGVDLEKSPHVLEAAYNDAQGVTAEFNLNLLRRINHELRADFQLDQWGHHAPYNRQESRMEMHLISRCPQCVHIGGKTICFEDGESILTECSYKYTPATFAHLAAGAGWRLEHIWMDEGRLFSVQYFTVA